MNEIQELNGCAVDTNDLFDIYDNSSYVLYIAYNGDYIAGFRHNNSGLQLTWIQEHYNYINYLNTILRLPWKKDGLIVLLRITNLSMYSNLAKRCLKMYMHIFSSLDAYNNYKMLYGYKNGLLPRTVKYWQKACIIRLN